MTKIELQVSVDILPVCQTCGAELASSYDKDEGTLCVEPCTTCSGKLAESRFDELVSNFKTKNF